MNNDFYKFEDCMLWAGGSYSNGYGVKRCNGRLYSIHRLMYESYVGLIPEGLEIDHLCRMRGCFNVEHLELVTHLENMQRISPTEGGCRKGHSYKDNEKTSVSSKTGIKRRRCLRCWSDWKDRTLKMKVIA